uniref:Uncharacterized protein n=1 Tax=Rhizophora mucronata TaxID=61149 RepID=A0A2P2P552_RHIMU
MVCLRRLRSILSRMGSRMLPILLVQLMFNMIFLANLFHAVFRNQLLLEERHWTGIYCLGNEKNQTNQPWFNLPLMEKHQMSIICQRDCNRKLLDQLQ